MVRSLVPFPPQMSRFNSEWYRIGARADWGTDFGRILGWAYSDCTAKVEMAEWEELKRRWAAVWFHFLKP